MRLMALGAAVVLSLVVGVLVYVFLMRKMTGEMVLAAVLTTVALGILLRGADRADLVGAAAIPGAGAGHGQSVAVAARRRAHLAVLGCAGADQRARLWRHCSYSCVSVAGACACARRGKIRCWPRSAASTCTRLRPGLGPLDAHRRACRHADGARLRADQHDGGDRAQGVSGGIGRRARQPRSARCVGALIVAAAEVLLIHYVDPLLSDVVPFLVLIAMLIVRPWGLFGTREELDRV